nr:protein kinase 4 isoform X2 [Onthophagus taurus]
MPLYGDTSLYSSSTSQSPLVPSYALYLSSPYSGHSSLIGSYTRPPSFSKPSSLTRFHRNFAPHLATISENPVTSLRRKYSPQLRVLNSSKIIVPRPIKINTADIDVSANKYRHQPPRTTPITTVKKEPEEQSNEVKKESINKPIRRDRATVRIHTIHKDKKDKKWRQNFNSYELNTDKEKNAKELTDKQEIDENEEEEDKLQDEVINVEAPSLPKSPSFHDICTAISTDSINEELNPGQPLDVVRKQSRTFSSDDLLKHLRRNSTEIHKEDVKNINTEEINNNKEEFESRGSVRKKRKVIKKKSNQKLSDENNTNLFPEKLNQEHPLQRRQSRKLPVRDISKVEVEEIRIAKPKPKTLFTATVDIEETKPSLKLIVDDVKVEEKVKPKKFKLDVTVEVEEKPNKKELKTKVDDKGKMYIPNSKPAIITDIKKKEQRGSLGDICEGIAEMPKKRNIDTKKKDETKNEIKKNNKELIKYEKISNVPKKFTEINQLNKSNEENKESNLNLKQPLQTKNSNQINEEEKKVSNETKWSSKLRNLSTSGSESNLKTPISQETNLKTSKSDSKLKQDVKVGNDKSLKENKEVNSIPKWKLDLKKSKEAKDLKQPQQKEIKSIIKSSSDENQEKKIGFKKSVSIEEKKNDDNVETEKVGEDNESTMDFWGIIGSKSSVYEKKPVKLKNVSLKSSLKNDEKAGENQNNVVNQNNDVNQDNEVNQNDEVNQNNEINQNEELKSEDNASAEDSPLKLSNRLSHWMHPFKKPEQFDECPVEIYATPKNIRRRHFPKPRQVQEESEESTSDDDESSEDEEGDVGKSTSSNDSGFNSSHGQKRTKERNLAPSDTRDSPTSNPAHNPAFALDAFDGGSEDFQMSSTFASFQKSGRITPPATTIPRFRKYTIDDFNFLKVLGKGSFGKVLLAELKDTEYYYAIKCLKKDVVLEDDDVECTLIERKVLALGTKHPYLCHLLCTFQTESHLFFVMEYLNGGDLMFHIQQSGRFSEPRARFYGAEIVSGLKFLHTKGIVYRDLKLDNVLLDFDGHVRIADFGMCKLQIFLDRMADTFCGTPDYMAPEIIKGQHYNQCVDWWSFGVLLYEMLIGQSPFSGCDEDELFWSICNEKPVLPRFLSTEANSILSQLLEKDWNKRLGYKLSLHGDIQSHPFFGPISWDLLELRHLEAPFKPNLQHPLDTQYFDKTFTVEKAKLTPIENNILQSMDQTQFQGFSYTNPNATDR